MATSRRRSMSDGVNPERRTQGWACCGLWRLLGDQQPYPGREESGTGFVTVSVGDSMGRRRGVGIEVGEVDGIEMSYTLVPKVLP